MAANGAKLPFNISQVKAFAFFGSGYRARRERGQVVVNAPAVGPHLGADRYLESRSFDAKQFESRNIDVTDIPSLEALSRLTFLVLKHRQFESRNIDLIDIPSLEGFAKLTLRISNHRSDQHCDHSYV